MKPKVLFIGGRIFKDLSERNPQSFETADILSGISPFSFSDRKTDIGTSLDITKDFNSYFKKHKSDYIAVNLENLNKNLYKSGEVYYTASNETAKLLKDKYETVIPRKDDPSEWTENLDCFIRYVMENFPSDKVFLVKSHRPDYKMIKDEIKTMPVSDYNEWIGKFEKYFSDKTGCKVIDIAKHYFLKVPQGKNLVNFLYEDEFYNQLEKSISSAIEGKDYKEDYSGTLKRYIGFSNNLLDKKKPFSVVFYKNDVCDRLVLDLSKEVVCEYMDIISVIKECSPKNLDETVDIIKEKFPDNIEFMEIVRGISAVRSGNLLAEDINYSLLFYKKCLVGGRVIELLRKYFTENDKDFIIKIINLNNWLYYFYIMRSQAAENIEEKYSFLNRAYELAESGKYNIKPVVIDIWGSCVSRVSCNFNEDNIAVKNYFFNVNPLSQNTPAIENLSEQTDKGGWYGKMVKCQLENEVYKTIEENRSEWIVIDLFVIASEAAYKIGDKIFNDPQNVLKSVSERKSFAVYKMPEKEFKKEFDLFLDKISEFYGEKVILVKNRFNKFYIDSADVITEFKNISNISLKNEFIEKWADYAVRKLGCYCIDINKKFLSDEISFLGNAAAHYENEFYIETGRLIQLIASNSPAQKIYTIYNAETKLDRILKLMKKNQDRYDIISEIFDECVLDKCVLNMEYEMLQKYKADILRMYKGNFNSISDILEYYDFSECKELYEYFQKYRYFS